jgi:hypothetical protein
MRVGLVASFYFIDDVQIQFKVETTIFQSVDLKLDQLRCRRRVLLLKLLIAPRSKGRLEGPGFGRKKENTT